MRELLVARGRGAAQRVRTTHPDPEGEGQHGGGGEADDHSSALVSASSQRLQRMQALRDAAQQLSERISSLSYQRRGAREQDDISAPTRALADDEVAAMTPPLRHHGSDAVAPAFDDEHQQAGAALGFEDREDDADSAGLVEELEVEDEELASGERLAPGPSLDESLKQVEKQLDDKRRERQRVLEAKALAGGTHKHETGVRGLVNDGPLVRGLLPARHQARDAGDADAAAGTAIHYHSRARQELEAGARAAPGQQDFEYESIEMQRSRISVLARRPPAAFEPARDGSLFAEQEDEGSGLEDIMREMAGSQDHFSLLKTLRREESARARAQQSPSHPSPLSLQLVPGDLPHASADGGAADEDGVRQAQQEPGWAVTEPGEGRRMAHEAARQESAADRLIARANQLLPQERGGAEARATDRDDEWLAALEYRAAARSGGSGSLAQLSPDDLKRHQRHLQSYLAHRDGVFSGAEGEEEEACVVDLVFEPAWARGLAAEAHHDDDDGGGGGGADLDSKAARVVFDVAECLQVGVRRLEVVEVSAGDARVRLRVAAGIEALRPGLVDTLRPHEIVAQLISAALDTHSALRQRPSLSLLSDCRVYSRRAPPPPAQEPSESAGDGAPGPGGVAALAASTLAQKQQASPAAPDLAMTMPTMAGNASALAMGVHATVTGSGERRLTAAQLQQRLLAEVDYLDEMHNAEHQLVSMVQVQQVAAAQEEAVVLAQALLDRERSAAEDKEREARHAAQSGEASAELVSVLRQSLKETTDAFLEAVSTASKRQEPTTETLDQMRHQHAQQLQSVVDAFRDSLAAGGGGGGSGGVAAASSRASRQASPRRPGQVPSPLHKAGTPRSAGAADTSGGQSLGGGGKDSSTSGVESDYTADFEDINEQSIAEDEAAAAAGQASMVVDEVASPAPSPAGKRGSMHYDATQSIADDVEVEASAHVSRDTLRDAVRGDHSILSAHARGRGGSSRGLSPAGSIPSRSDRSRPPSVSLRDDGIDDELPTGLDEDTINDEVGDDMLSRTGRESLVASERAASHQSLSRQAAHQSQHYSEDFEEQYSDDFESRISQSADASRLHASSHGHARSGAKAAGGSRPPSPSPKDKTKARSDVAAEAGRDGGRASGELTMSDGMVDLKLVMPELPAAMQADAATRNAVTLVEQSLREAQVRAEQHMALLRLQEQALDERALVQLRRIADQHRVLQAGAAEDGEQGRQVCEERQRRLDEEERSTRMRLAADKADLQRQRAAARAELLRRQVDLQEQTTAFLASRTETLVLKGLLPPQPPHADAWQLQLPSHHLLPARDDVGAAPAAREGQRWGGERRGEAVRQVAGGEDDEMADNGETSYLSDAFESVASEMLEYLDEQRDAQGAEDEQRLHMQSVRELANQLGSNQLDPTGRSLAARQHTAAEKRQYALQLLGEKEAAVGRRRRELQVEAEERRTEELLAKALSLNVDEEARKHPPPDDEQQPVWDMMDAPMPGTPASFVSPRLPSSPALAARTSEQEEEDAPRTPARQELRGVDAAAAAGNRGAALGVRVEASSDEEDDDLTPPRSVASVRSPDGQGLFVRTAFDPMSAAARGQGTLTSDLSDALSEASVDQEVATASAASSPIQDLVEHGMASGSRALGADSIADDLAVDSSYLGQPHSEVTESIDESGAALRPATPTQGLPAESIAYSMDFDKDNDGDGSAAASGSVSEALYSDDFEQATGGASMAQAAVPRSVSASEVYSQDFEDASSVHTRARGSATLVDTSVAAYSNTFEAESPSQAYSNTFETETGGAGTVSAAVRRTEEEEEEEEIIEETPGEVSSSSSIAQELGLSAGEGALASSASSSDRAAGKLAAAAGPAVAGNVGAASAGVSGDSKGADDVYSDSFVGESLSQSMAADAGENHAVASPASQRARGDGLDKTAVYSDSFVGIDSHEASSVLGHPNPAEEEAAAGSGQEAAADRSVAGDSVATDMSGIEPDAQEEPDAQDEQRHVQQHQQEEAAQRLQQCVRGMMARRNLQARLDSQIERQRQEKEQAPEERRSARPPSPSPAREGAETAAAEESGAAGEHASVPAGEAGGASIAEDSMQVWEGDQSAASLDAPPSPACTTTPHHASADTSPRALTAEESVEVLGGRRGAAALEEEALDRTEELEQGEEMCPPVSSPELSPSPSEAAAPAAVSAYDPPALPAPDLEAAQREAEEAGAAADDDNARARLRASQMVAVSDALLAEVLEELVGAVKRRPLPPTTTTAPATPPPRSPAATRPEPSPEATTPTRVGGTRWEASVGEGATPSPSKQTGRGLGSEGSSAGPSPGALALMAPIDSPVASPRPPPSPLRDLGSRALVPSPSRQADEAAAAATAAHLATAAASKSSAAAVSYATVLLHSMSAASYEGGLEDDTFLHLARSRFSAVGQDQHVFHKLVFDVVKSELHKHARAASARCSLHQAPPCAYGAPVPLDMTPDKTAHVHRQVLAVVQGLAASGDFPAQDAAEPAGKVPGSDLDLAALQALVDADLIQMEKEWVQYEEEEDVIKVAVADALLDDLLLELTSDLVGGGSAL